MVALQADHELPDFLAIWLPWHGAKTIGIETIAIPYNTSKYHLFKRRRAIAVTMPLEPLFGRMLPN